MLEKIILYTFFYISNLVAKAPGLNLGKKLTNLLSNREALKISRQHFVYFFPSQKRLLLQCNAMTFVYTIGKYPAGNYLFKVNNKSTRTRCEICSKLTIKTPEQRLASFWCLYC